MGNFVTDFYKRNKKNKFKHYLLLISLGIIMSTAIPYIISDLILKRPQYNPTVQDTSYTILDYIFAKEGFIFFSCIVLFLFFVDLFVYKKNKC